MFPYTGKYNEFDSDIQNKKILYKIHQAHPNTFETTHFFESVENNRNILNSSISYFEFCINSIIHSL